MMTYLVIKCNGMHMYSIRYIGVCSVKFIDVHCHKLHLQIGYNYVQHEHYCCHVFRLGYNPPWVVYVVPNNSDT